MAEIQDFPQINEDPDAYGSRGEKWNPEFVAYMKAIVTHPAYDGMPDAIKEDGKIQWEAPSNRKGGQYQYTHNKRRDWWRRKAEGIGIDPASEEWISRTAKRIHPTGEKPCKRCGRTMRIAYTYPNFKLKKRLSSRFKDFDFDPLEPITDLIQRLVDTYGQSVLGGIPDLLSTKRVRVENNPAFTLDDWLAWIEDRYIPREPSLLSPGAMSNAPDRFDGFHSFNLCCRKKADRGRHDANMRLYSTDRRVFEYWSDGDWIAADRLMGIISAKYRDHACADGGKGLATPDHIGPLSLGFAHRPEFRLLSSAANSAKSNRMTEWDVRHLLSVEQKGEEVISWHAKDLWDRRKVDVHEDETALRLSKMLRDNQRNAMRILGMFLKEHHFMFLAGMLGLERADYDVEFLNLRINEDFVTEYDDIQRRERTTRYALEQKARRLRVAFEELRTYLDRDNRHLFIIENADILGHIAAAMGHLKLVPGRVTVIDKQLGSLFMGEQRGSEEALREIAEELKPSEFDCEQFKQAADALQEAIKSIALEINNMWDSDRYVRGPFDLDQV